MPTRPLQILLAEDDGGHARLLRRSLAQMGLANPVVHVVDGQQALDYLLCEGEYRQRNTGDPLLVVLDVTMPRLGGADVLRHLQVRLGSFDLPVLMLTTTDDPREVAPCLEVGCRHFLKKPVAYPAFVEALREMGLLLQVVPSSDRKSDRR